jgi:enoyl-CoA hydratase/carnithine racemase
MTTRVLLKTTAHVAEVTLNRPEKHNAIDLAMFEALAETGTIMRPLPASAHLTTSSI